MSAWTAQREADLAAKWQQVPIRDLASQLGTSVGAVYRQARKLGLKTSRRTPKRMAANHPAVREGRPRYGHTIVTAETSRGLFISGFENKKIGRRVTKGRWSGLPIYTLTLAERLTCPRSCLMWDGCYGNNLNWSARHVLDRDLIERMRWELTALAARHPAGFVIRLHVLGDFGSDQDPELALEYVAAWERWVERFEQMRVFGYTAHPPASAVGKAVMRVNRRFADRCRIRFSGTALAGFGALVVERAEDSRHVLCPYETGRVADCATCGLCWTMQRPVEFVRH